jgi:hypothetical protein
MHLGAPASQFKCSVWQPSVQFRAWRPIFGIRKGRGHPAVMSFGVCESRHQFACGQNPGRPFHGRFTSRQTRTTALGSCVRSSWQLSARLPVKKSSFAFSGWSLGAAGAGRWSGPVRCQFGGSASRVSRTVGRCNQEMQCSLTLRSSGAPTACHQAWSVGARTFSTAQAWRHAVGAPLSSNVRRHTSCVRAPPP